MRLDTAIVTVGVITHGFLDIMLTTAIWFFESNPVVLSLGVRPWLAIKIVALSAFLVVYLSNDYHIRYITYAAALMASIGVLAVLSNLAYLYIYI